MAACEYGQIVGGTCGSSVDNSGDVKIVILAKCTKSTQGHLRYFNIRDTMSDSDRCNVIIGAGRYVVTVCMYFQHKLVASLHFHN